MKKFLINGKGRDLLWLSFATLLILSITGMTTIVPVDALPEEPKIFVDPAEIVTNTTLHPACTNFTVEVRIANVTNLAGIQFELWWNSTLLSGVSMEEVLFAENTPSGEESNIWRLADRVTSDHIEYGYTYMNLEQGTTGGYLPINITDESRVLARITLHVEKDPTETDGFLETLLEIKNCIPGDMDGELISHTTEDGYFKLNWTDNVPPSIGIPSQEPSADNVMADEEVKVSVNVTDADSGVGEVTLSYTINDGTSWDNVTMSYNSTTSLYEGIIPGQSLDITVKYKITAYDNANNSAVQDNAGEYYPYLVIPEFSTWLSLSVTIFLITIATILVKRKHKPHRLSVAKQSPEA